MITVLACDTNNIKELLEAAGYTVTTQTIDTVSLYKITINGSPVQVLNPGMTKVEIATALTTLRYSDGNAPSEIIITGNCASPSCEVRIGTMAIGSSALQRDVDFCPAGVAKGAIPGLEKGIFYSYASYMNGLVTALKELNYTGRTGRFASGDQIVDCPKEACSIARSFKSCFIDTEVGDIGEWCYIYNIPWAVVKGVSNHADGKFYCEFKTYSDAANSASLKVALKMLDDTIVSPA